MSWPSFNLSFFISFPLVAVRIREIVHRGPRDSCGYVTKTSPHFCSRLFFLLAMCQLQLLTLSKRLHINGNCHVSTEHDTSCLLAVSVCKFLVTHSGVPVWGLFFSIQPLSLSWLFKTDCSDLVLKGFHAVRAEGVLFSKHLTVVLFCPQLWIHNIFVYSSKHPKPVLESVVRKVWSSDQQHLISWGSIRNADIWAPLWPTQSGTLGWGINKFQNF